MYKTRILGGLGRAALAASLWVSIVGDAQAAGRVQVTFWHAMGGKLGEVVEHLVDEYNASQHAYRVVPVYKGNYKDTFLGAIAALRAHNPPDIVQIYDVGTGTMMAAKGAYVPVYRLMQENGVAFSTKAFIGGAASYYANTRGELVSMPFNSSTPVLFYNRSMFAKAGVEPPRTWAEMGEVGQKLRTAGDACGFTIGWPAWTQFEQFSVWNGLRYATQDNGYRSVHEVRLLIDSPAYEKHLARLGAWSKNGIFEYGGAESKGRSLFIGGHCAMYIGSSGSLAAIKNGAQFPYGIAPMPYQEGLKSAPQNTVVGGASLWVMAGQPKSHYRAVASFLAFMMSSKAQTYWASHTGYVPVTVAGYKALETDGFYQREPGAKVAIEELTYRAPKAWTMGIRLGFMPQIRQIERDQMEAVFTGRTSAHQALATIVKKGDVLLKQFGDTYR
ncbi:sn-glycerol-3-phosphate ABC transporter substrate-binding protein UgpB [Acidihalobacter prosperus]|uniref:sn-glycerol-3-phosphate-binding periplasmic protein UgpB n=1 Tax=Acidihalobacter prosperus TaxID=160660 RepID=A0A1A6C7Z8_9GAMM|nr:sn-glycerol-3-phosphate ABC transporter substrate-binding protein UgpB [Acidihalobacter prosperus]OBS10675.1 hypothetical protein Thpro_020391 [Acidihalobacter prosperus]